MVAVIFEFTPSPGRFPDYMELVGQFKPELDRAEGFISLDRFELCALTGRSTRTSDRRALPAYCPPVISDV